MIIFKNASISGACQERKWTVQQPNERLSYAMLNYDRLSYCKVELREVELREVEL